MVTLQQAITELANKANVQEWANAMFDDTIDDVMPMLTDFEGLSGGRESLATVAMMLSLFITALRKYPDLTV